MSRPDAVLHGWYRYGTAIKGHVYFDRKGRFPDGFFIQTTAVLSGPDENGIIKTSNSTYLLGASVEQLLHWKQPAETVD